jgi:hypothetical protein
MYYIPHKNNRGIKMSKWIDTKKFEDFKKEREEDKSEKKDNITFARRYPNPKMGTHDKPKEYHLRLLTDPNRDFYKKYHYHMFESGDQWVFIMCPKTKDMDAYCPWCHATQLLYKGSSSDKKKAYNYKRKDKYVGNVFVVKDPRDVDENDPDKRLTGKTFLYEFPQTIETLIRKEITDVENGWGYEIFNPENGYNLIISIGAKKPDKNGKVWPDYSLTTFAKRPSAIADSEEEIEEIMNTCQDISEYIDKSMLSPEEHKKYLKAEMLWDDVEDQFMRHMQIGEEKTEESKPSEPETKSESKPSKPKKETKVEKTEEADTSDDGLSDEELLAELESLG